MTVPLKLSVPEHHRRPPRELTEAERVAFERIADALIPATAELGSPSQIAGFGGRLDLALAARSDGFSIVVELALRVGSAPDTDLLADLEQCCAEDPAGFHLLSSVVAGAYLMLPQVRLAIGYPGQRRHHPQFDEAADQIMDGILDPVIERGRIYTPAPEISSERVGNR